MPQLPNVNVVVPLCFASHNLVALRNVLHVPCVNMNVVVTLWHGVTLCSMESWYLDISFPWFYCTLHPRYQGELSLVHAGFESLVHAGFVSLVHAGSQVVSSRDHVVQKGEASKLYVATSFLQGDPGFCCGRSGFS